MTDISTGGNTSVHVIAVRDGRELTGTGLLMQPDLVLVEEPLATWLAAHTDATTFVLITEPSRDISERFEGAEVLTEDQDGSVRVGIRLAGTSEATVEPDPRESEAYATGSIICWLFPSSCTRR